jgi:hypothetical protein
MTVVACDALRGAASDLGVAGTFDQYDPRHRFRVEVSRQHLAHLGLDPAEDPGKPIPLL